MLGDPHFFFGRSLPFLILSIILKNTKYLYVGSFNYFLNTIQTGSNWYMDTAVRDLEVACFKVDGTSFPDAGSLVTTAHVTREICPRDLKYRKSKTNMAAQKLLHTRCFFFPVCPRLDQNESCPLGVSC